MKSSAASPWHASLAALAAALALALPGCGGGVDQPPEEPVDNGRAQALAVSKPGELVAYMQERLRTRQAQRLANPVLAQTGAPAPGGAAADAAPARSGTLVQEEGVDEADLLQSDGQHLYAMQPLGGNAIRLQVYARAANGSLATVRSLTLSQPDALDVTSDGMHFSADGRTMAVISQAWGGGWPVGAPCPLDACIAPPMPSRASVGVQRVDVSDPGAATAGTRLDIEGRLVDSRRIGTSLILVTSHTPRLAADELPATATTAQREAAIAALQGADVLPTIRRDGGAAAPLLAETDCYVQPANRSPALEVTTITVIDLQTPELTRISRCVLGGTQALYMSAANLYLATTRYAYVPFWDPMPTYEDGARTDVHKFALDAGTVQYRGSGSVQGHLGWDAQKNSYRFSEHNGDLRVLTFTNAFGWRSPQDVGTVAPSPALLSVLRERAADLSLQVVASLPNSARPAHLGKPGEQVYGVRFVGDRGYVVTFRRTDPLYVLDLADPADPRITGELHTAGFSDYLFPLPGGLLLGVGHDANEFGMTTGVKMALIDVANPAQPLELASLTLGHGGSASALDFSRHGLNLLMKDGVARIALPVKLAPSTALYTDPWQAGLQRFEVDTTARTLRNKGMVGASLVASNHATWLERSLQVGDHLYYLGSGVLTAHDW